MDFTFTPEQDEAAALAAKILTGEVTLERQRAAEASGARFDAELWATLGDAFDWTDLDLITVARVLVEAGRVIAPVPLASHAACVALLGSLGLEATAGLYAAAVAEDLEHLPVSPTVTADADGLLTGTKTLVRAGTVADTLLVTATSPDGAGVHLIRSADAPDLVRAAQHTSDGDTTAQILLHRTPSTRIGDAVAAARLGDLLTALACAEQLGIVEGALAETADYARTREQFDRPIGSFQAVSQRLADGYIDVLCLRLTTWQAIWRLSEDLPAEVEVATAKLWAADAGHRLAHTAVHVHGGVGIDLDSTTHRYFTAAKRFEMAYGGATEQALRIGRAFAR
ncbi:MAG: acyl-CoA dehydrogenase family protein [Nocardioides sp.]